MTCQSYGNKRWGYTLNPILQLYPFLTARLLSNVDFWVSYSIMKLSTPVLKTLLMTASMTMVVPILAQSAPSSKSKVNEKSHEPPESETVLPGSVVPHGGGWLSLSLAGGTFRLGFYDANKRPVDMPFIRATARWNSTLRTSEQRLVLNPSGDGKTLKGNKPVKPPYVFKVYLTLMNADDSVGASYVIDFRG